MIRFLMLVGNILWLMLFPFWPLFWLLCRLEAKPCPRCGSRWKTTLVGEWDGEQWGCNACGHWWETRGHNA